MRYKFSKKVLLFLCLFVGIGAVYGSVCMFIDPTGKILHMENLLPYFNVLPFSNYSFKNYIFSGIALLIVNGITNLIASYLLIKNKKSGIILGTTFGITLMLWITIQFIIFPLNLLSVSFYIIGLLQTIIGYTTYVFYTQNCFKFSESKYKNINKNKDNLVVYFSRMGYTKQIAYEKANELGATIIELKTKEKTSGTLGFWWCERYGVHKWRMNIEKLNININEYKNVIIVSPIWVFDICSPIRDFSYKYAKDIKRVEYIFTHYMKSKFINVANKLDKILNNKRKSYTSICIRLGKIKEKTVC